MKKKRQKILYIWDADYPWDVRVEKICKSLEGKGYEVHVAARNLQKLSEYEYSDGLHIHRLRTWRYDKINYALSFPAFFSPIWQRFLDNIIKKNGIELIIVRDLPMAPAGIWAGRRNKIPVIFDMAEDYVSMIWNKWKFRNIKVLNFFVRNPYLAKFVEKYSFKNADHILIVVDEAREVIRKGGGNLGNVTIVGNTPLIEQFSNYPIKMNHDLKLIKERFSAIYTGGIQLGRGLQTVFDAMQDVIKGIPDFLFVVVGHGYATDELKKIVQDKKLQDHVLWIGWVDHKKIFDYIKCANIGLIPHFVTKHTNTTIPNKIFDYMACGVPVISSNAVPMKRILDSERCGITFKSRDAKDLSRAILNISISALDYCENGMRAVRNRYNWNENEKRLYEVVQKFNK